MKCPFCGFKESKVADSRTTDDGNVIRRRRICIKCRKRFTTYEKLETISLIVRKKDGSNQTYDHDKVISGIVHACEKRPVSIAQMEALVEDIESELYQLMVHEVSSADIGEKVMIRLRALDEVAYIRFASVYKRFDNIATFMNEITELINNNVRSGKFIDLHTHSSASDGSLTPSMLAKHAHTLGLCAVALTDHDTTDGLKEFKKACEEYGIEPVCGIEISAKYGSQLHIVGLFINEDDKAFTDALDRLKQSRADRNERILRLLAENGMDITLDDVIAQKSGGSTDIIGRPHFAKAMLEKGYVSSVDEAFNKYLKRGMPCYAERFSFSPEECINMIHQANGIAVLAHPNSVSEDKNVLSELLIRLTDAGLDGMECYYHGYSDEFQNTCFELCREFNLIPSGGSDFHGENKPLVHLGKVNDNDKIPYSVLEQMKKMKGLI